METLAKLSQAATKDGLYDLLKKGEELDEQAMANAFICEESINKVKVHISKGYVRICLGNIKDLNIQGLDSDEKEFGEKSGNNYIVTAFSEQFKKIASIENSIRKYRDNFSVGHSDYMQLTTFEEEFFPLFDEKKDSFDEVINEIGQIYDQEIASFTSKVRSLSSKACPNKLLEIEREIRRINSVSVNDFLAKFEMGLETNFDISQVGDQKLKEIIEESNKAFVKRTFAQFQKGMIQELFNATAVFYKGVNGCLTESLLTLKKTKENIRKAAVKVQRDNVGNLPFISQAIKDMIELSESCFKTVALDKAYELLAILYGKALDLEYSLDTKQLPDEISALDLEYEYEEILMEL